MNMAPFLLVFLLLKLCEAWSTFPGYISISTILPRMTTPPPPPSLLHRTFPNSSLATVSQERSKKDSARRDTLAAIAMSIFFSSLQTTPSC